MVISDLVMLELPFEITEENSLYLNAALEWLSDHTKLQFDKDKIESVLKLPVSARVFLVKYCEIMEQAVGVTSESIGGMSQSFTDETSDQLLWQTAKSLLGPYMKSQLKSVPHVSKWR